MPVGTPAALLPNTLNAAPAEIYGAELELTGQFGALGFNLGLSALQSEFTEDATLTDSQTNTNRLVPEGSDRAVRAGDDGERGHSVRVPDREA